VYVQEATRTVWRAGAADASTGGESAGDVVRSQRARGAASDVGTEAETRTVTRQRRVERKDRSAAAVPWLAWRIGQSRIMAQPPRIERQQDISAL